MRFSARLTLAAACCTLAFTSACSDSTSPNDSQTPAHLAAHFDSLYVSATAQETNGYTARAELLSFLEIAPAFGATASTVTVTTASGTEHWKGFELADVTTSGGTPNDTTYLLVAYREAEAHTMLLAFYRADGSIQDGGIFTNDTLSVQASDGSGSTTRTSLGSTCTTPSSSLVNPVFANITPLECNTATFSTSMSLTVPSTPNVDPALTSLAFTTTSFSGVRILEGAAGGQAAVRRVRALLRSVHGGNRL